MDDFWGKKMFYLVENEVFFTFAPSFCHKLLIEAAKQKVLISLELIHFNI